MSENKTKATTDSVGSFLDAVEHKETKVMSPSISSKKLRVILPY